LRPCGLTPFGSHACKPLAGSPSVRRMAPLSSGERHRPEQTTLDRLVQQPAATFSAQAEDAAGVDSA